MFYILTSLITTIITYYIHKYIIYNDYKLVWTTSGEWQINGYDDIGEAYFHYEYSIYEILYSKRKNSYKLNLKGYCPKEHNMYAIAIEKYNEIINNNQKIK